MVNRPTGHSHVSNPLCGDEIDLTIRIEKGRIEDVKFKGQGCAISKASASMVTAYLKGKPKDELKKIDKKFIIKLLGIELGVNRIKCKIFSLEAVKKLEL
ncbi:iron-sulfur cluster assembly scaffold protein [Patescibacteria group bacterium]|nr:iron-sulfur cluster assembly scaffold protein [Patescibacteria group bacterium]